MTPQINYQQLKGLFITPEATAANVPFGNPPNPATLKEAKVVAYGVPFDDTATFGKGADRGPEGLRHVSARQIETFVVDEELDFYEKIPLFDLGDLKLTHTLTPEEQHLLYEGDDATRKKIRAKLANGMKQLEAIKDITRLLHEQGKIPLLLGGEHTLTYWPLVALAHEKPVVLHFDAHRDAKKDYLGLTMCHTTPMYHALHDSTLEPTDFIQIGIRQTDQDEQAFANKSGITTFYPKDITTRFSEVLKWITNKTKNRNVYITIDIDVLDIPYVPCTGTPEPFGLTPQQMVEIFKAINPSARLIGADMMEVAVKNNDYREATVAVQLLLRLLCREYVK